MAVTYDTGALIAADHGERRMWARHVALLRQHQTPTIPAPVLAQAWRGGTRQARLAKLVLGCQVEALDDIQARRVGRLAAQAKADDIVDATVVEGALRRRDLVIGSDPDDLRSIAGAVGYRLEVERP